MGMLPSKHVTLVLKKHPNINKQGTIVIKEGSKGCSATQWLGVTLALSSGASGRAGLVQW